MLPQIIILSALLVRLIFLWFQKGEVKYKTIGFWKNFFMTILIILVLYWGGFFYIN